MKRNRKNRKSLSYGTLEPKRLLAGNVNANVGGEHIYIRGDSLDNQIRIVADGGKISISGLEGTTINGSDSVIVENSSAVSGDSRISSEFDGGLRVHMGAGNDSVDVQGIRLNELSIIYGGTGNDQVSVANTDVTDTAVVQTFSGDDSITITNTLVTGNLWALTLDGDDSLIVDNSETRGTAILATGSGDDFLRLTSNKHLGATQYALTGDGDDTVVIQNPSVGVGSLGIYTGDGDDDVTGELVSGEIDGNVVIAGQGGIDFGQMTIDSSIASKVSVRGFEYSGDIVFQNGSQVDAGFATYSKPTDSFFVADFVEFPQATYLSSIEWLGSYENSDAPLSGDSFVVEIYEGGFVQNANIGTYQAPVGNAVARINVGNNANRVDTGETWTDTVATRKIYSYSADIEFLMAPNKQYWISIYAMPTSSQGADFNNDYYTLVENVALPDRYNGAANVKLPGFDDWIPDTSGKTVFSLRS